MPQDFLQIALEHHRAGRLKQAEAGYKAILASEPGNAEALHWLGVLCCQAGELKQAILWLEQAASLRPDDAAYLHNLAQAYLSAGRKDEAIKTFERAAAADPTRGEALAALAMAYLSRRFMGDADHAIDALRRAQAAGLQTPQVQHQLAIALLAAGRHAEAVEACNATLAKKPDDAMIYYHLALAHRGAGQVNETRKALLKALELEPGMAPAWCGLAVLNADAERFAEAAAFFQRAIEAQRDYPAAYQGLGRVLQQDGKADEAVKAFALAVRASRGQLGKPAPRPTSIAAMEKKITPTLRQAQFHYALSALADVFPPPQVPSEAVAGLFDKYAGYFDDHLVGQLGYRLPGMIAEAIAAQWSGQPMNVLDLGCGTGLCGPLLKPMAATLVGIDLSPAMIEKAKERGVYDRLEVGELVATLRKSPRAYDLLVAADVLIYTGDLFPFFEAAARALRPGGLLAFSVEAGGGDRFGLVKRTRRFTHSQIYVQRLAAMHALEEKMFAPIIVRMEAEHPVPGYLVIVRSPSISI